MAFLLEPTARDPNYRQEWKKHVVWRIQPRMRKWLIERNVLQYGSVEEQWFISNACSLLVLNINATLNNTVPVNQSILSFADVRSVEESEWNEFDFMLDVANMRIERYNITKITPNTSCNCFAVNDSICSQYPKISLPPNNINFMQGNKCPFIKISAQEMRTLNIPLENTNAQSITNTTTEFEICVENFLQFTKSFPVSLTADIVLTYGCFGFSCLSGIFFVIVFIKVPSIRTIPTSTITNLVVCTILVQIAFVSGIGLDKYPDTCKVVGMILHYLWLCNFTWSVICGVHMVRVFKRMQVGAVVFSSKTLMMYMMIGYLAPLLFISAFVIGEFCECYPIKIEYGGKLCFLNTNKAILYGMDIPVFTTLLVNICLFLAVIKIIRARTSIRKNDSYKERQCFVIYLRLVSAMNFSWILGVVAKWTNVAILWYVFTVVNGLQGTFLLLSFITWKNIIQAFRRRKSNSKLTNLVAGHKRTRTVGVECTGN